jgi:hypothetical protein
VVLTNDEETDMFVNLHNLPTGQSMYTLYLTMDPVGTPRDELCAEEIDVVASSRASVAEIIAAASAELEDYEPSIRIIGVVNQSDGYVMQDVAMTGDLR